VHESGPWPEDLGRSEPNLADNASGSGITTNLNHPVEIAEDRRVFELHPG